MDNALLSAEALLLARGYLYELFHKALGGYPTPELVGALCAPETLDALEEFSASSEKVAELRQLVGGLAQTVADEEALAAFVDSARDEYTRLFIGPGALPAQPMETPHVSHEMILFSENTVAVRRIYKSHGFVPEREFHVADDHVSLMCDFMARLSAETLAVLRSGSREALSTLASEQAAFAAGHMANWLPRFARLQSEAGKGSFYPKLSAALAEFASLDVLFLSEVIAWVAELPEPDFGYERPESFARLEAALEDLRAMRLFGLEDCELREIQRVVPLPADASQAGMPPSLPLKPLTRSRGRKAPGA